MLHVYSVLSSNRCGWQSSYVTQNKNNRHNINSRQTLTKHTSTVLHIAHTVSLHLQVFHLQQTL